MIFERAVLGSQKISINAQNLVQIQNGTFWRNHPSSGHSFQNVKKNPLFPDLCFALPALPLVRTQENAHSQQYWAILSANGATSFLDVLRGRHLCLLSQARSYPYLSSQAVKEKGLGLSSPSKAIRYVGFPDKDKSAGSTQGSYISARYESRQEETDWRLWQYLRGETELNPSEKPYQKGGSFETLLSTTVDKLRLEPLLSMPVNNLSNGQKRRARIAKALLNQPELLLLDDPFMGLDPPTHITLSTILRDLAFTSAPRLVMSLRPQDAIPSWITHIGLLGSNDTLAISGAKGAVLFALSRWRAAGTSNQPLLTQMADMMTRQYGEPMKFSGASITYTGIEPYEAYGNIVSSQDPAYVRPNGEMNPQYLSTAHRVLWEEASRKYSRDLDDLFVLCCTPPMIKSRAPLRIRRNATISGETHETPPIAQSEDDQGEPLIELDHVSVSYGSKTVLGATTQPGHSRPGLTATIRRGSRLLIVGPNGSGKTTLLSLLTSDHPQSYSLPIRYFGRSRLPRVGQPGLSLWEIQSRIGHSSPEIHALFPRGMTVRRALESAWADTFAGSPNLTDERTRLVDSFLRFWQAELVPAPSPDSSSSSASGDLDWASSGDNTFGVLPFQAQRLILFLRAIIKKPDIIIFDEAFSGFSSEVRDKSMGFLIDGGGAGSSGQEFAGLEERQALIVVSHVREEIPSIINEYLRLPGAEELEQGRGVERGTCQEGDVRTEKVWNQLWGLR